MGTSTTSGEMSIDMHSFSRTSATGSEQVMHADKTGPTSHVAVPETSVIIGKRLAKMTAKFEENIAASDIGTQMAHSSNAMPMDTALKALTVDSVAGNDPTDLSLDIDSAHLSEMVQAQIASSGEIAVLAAANQLPDAAMSFSASGK
jgi:hypothetical protein